MVEKKDLKVGMKLRIIKIPNYLKDKYKIGDLVEISNVFPVEDYEWLFSDYSNAMYSKDSNCFELITENKPKFKVGDKVKILWGRTNFIDCYGTNDGVVAYINNDERPRVKISSDKFDTTLSFNPEWLELVEEGCGGCVVSSENIVGTINNLRNAINNNEPDTSSKNKSVNIMSKLTTFVKNSLLSADEKLLRKYDLKDSCGDYTSEAEELVMKKLVKDNEAYLIEVATALEAEENKKK